MGRDDEHSAARELYERTIAELRLGPARPFTFDHYTESDGVTDHVELHAGTINVEEVHSFIAYVSAETNVTGGTLVLGGRRIPLPVGLTVVGGLLIRLMANDARQLIANGASAAIYLELMGEEIVGAPTLSMGRT